MQSFLRDHHSCCALYRNYLHKIEIFSEDLLTCRASCQIDCSKTQKALALVILRVTHMICHNQLLHVLTPRHHLHGVTNTKGHKLQHINPGIKMPNIKY